ncbi:transcription antiterminator [Streptococcus sp. ZJ93]|uniref:BglG family transcription antiterminator n=1 Tax=Streptococcus handemini TaxID=3161188 RepID=UPI0034D6D8A2
MLTKKEAAIMQVLLRQEGNYISSQKMAAAIGMSDRTVRKYLQSIEDKIANRGAELISKSGYGYQLSFQDEEQFQLYWQEWQQSDKLVKDVSQLEEATDRRHYIIHKLFLEAGSPTILDLSQELYLSKTSVSQLLTEIKDLVRPYGLEIQISRKGIQIVGSEPAIRHFIKDYFFMDSFQNSVFSLLQHDVLEESHFSDIIMIVIDECRNGQLQLPDFVLHNLVVHLALMMSRIRLGNPVQLVSHQEDKKSPEYQVATRILGRLAERFSIEFPENEAAYISIHLHGGKEETGSNQAADSVTRHLRERLERLGRQLATPLELDVHLLDSLKVHFIPFLHRIHNGIQLVNPLTEEIVAQYPEVLTAVKEVFSSMPELQGQAITDDEYAYISLHVLASLEKMSGQVRYRVLVVCASGYGSARMLKHRLENEFPAELDIVEVASYLDLTEQDLTGIDFIISSVDLSSVVFLVPVVKVSVLLQQQDIIRIRSHMTKRVWTREGPTATTRSVEKKGDLLEDVAQLFQEAQFLYLDQQVDKETVLSQMIHCLEEGDDLQFRQDFRKQIAIRENLSSVVYEEVLAFPHPPKALTQKEQVVIAVCRYPIYWDKEHDQVRFVFLLSPSTGKNERMKLVTPALAAFVHAPDLQEKLQDNPTVQQFRELFIPLL